jgi:hypothetical protein
VSSASLPSESPLALFWTWRTPQEAVRCGRKLVLSSRCYVSAGMKSRCRLSEGQGAGAVGVHEGSPSGRPIPRRGFVRVSSGWRGGGSGGVNMVSGLRASCRRAAAGREAGDRSHGRSMRTVWRSALGSQPCCATSIPEAAPLPSWAPPARWRRGARWCLAHSRGKGSAAQMRTPRDPGRPVASRSPTAPLPRGGGGRLGSIVHCGASLGCERADRSFRSAAPRIA